MTSFVVDLDLVEALVDQMATYGSQVEAVCADVDARLARVHATWTGAAASAHAAAHTRWAAGAQEMHTALAQLRAIASTAHGNYLSAMTANQQMWRL